MWLQTWWQWVLHVGQMRTCPHQIRQERLRDPLSINPAPSTVERAPPFPRLSLWSEGFGSLIYWTNSSDSHPRDGPPKPPSSESQQGLCTWDPQVYGKQGSNSLWVQTHATQVSPTVGAGGAGRKSPLPASPGVVPVSHLKSCCLRVTTVNEHAPKSCLQAFCSPGRPQARCSPPPTGLLQVTALILWKEPGHVSGTRSGRCSPRDRPLGHPALRSLRASIQQSPGTAAKREGVLSGLRKQPPCLCAWGQHSGNEQKCPPPARPSKSPNSMPSQPPWGASLHLACNEVLSVTPLFRTLMDLGTPSIAGSH